MEVLTIDINSDMGESFGPWTMGADAEVMPNITSANIACGAHAGDPGVMRRTVRLAKDHGVSVGAHPGFPDLQGFGRREVPMQPDEVEDFLIAQIGALAAIARTEGVPVRHVKAHGALYNMAARDARLAEAIARAMAAGLKVAAEGFADRAYEPDGSLTPRSRAGAVIHDPELVVARAVRMARDRVVLTAGGQEIPLDVDTICVHGDTPGAPELTRRIRRGLEAAGIHVRPLRG